MDKRLKVNFVPASNFGDTSVPYMLHKENVPFIFTHHSVEKKLVMTGSIIGIGSKKNTIVWGSGIIHNGITPNLEAIYLAVRGPRTLEKLHKQGLDTSKILLGDPAMTLPKIHNPKIEKKYKLGIIPHIMDFDVYRKYVNDNPSKFQNTIVLDPNKKTSMIEGFINQVLECKKIVSTSLHGIIVANAYGIPAVWSKISNKLYGDDVKFYDHFESIGVYDVKNIEFVEDENIEIEPIQVKLDVDSLWNSRPWLNISDDYFVDIDDTNWTKECYPEGHTDTIFTDNFFKLI